MKNITVSNLVKLCEDYIICSGTKTDMSGKLIIRFVAKLSKYLYENMDEEKPINMNEYECITYYRKPDCSVLTKGQHNLCESCTEYNVTFNK